MAVEKQNKNGRLKLKQDLAKGSFETLYILYGEEAFRTPTIRRRSTSRPRTKC